MHDEYDTISHQEFYQLLSGLNGETSLGYTVQIRSEKNPEKIQQMSNNEKQIRSKWMEFRRKNNKNAKQDKIFISKNEINEVLSKIFN